MRIFWSLAVASCMAWPSLTASAQEKSPPEKSIIQSDLKAAIQAEIIAHEKAVKDASEARRKAAAAAKTASKDAPTKAVPLVGPPRAEQAAKKILALIEKEPANPDAVFGASWILTQFGIPDETLKGTIQLVVKHHINSDGIADSLVTVASTADNRPKDHPVHELIKAGLASKSEMVKGSILFAQGQGKSQKVTTIKRTLQRSPDTIKQQMEPRIAALEKRIEATEKEETKKNLENQKKQMESMLASQLKAYEDAKEQESRIPELQKEAIGLLEQSEKLLSKTNYKQLPRLKGLLNEARGKLEVGQVAMEISGEDVDGKPIKLTDYRGKVVLLDFWGHW